MNNKQKVNKITTASKSIIDFMESALYGTAQFIALVAIEINALDFAIDGSFDGLYSHPKEYIAVFLSPIIIGSLITKLDPNSETASSINDMVNQLKPKIRKKERL